MTRTSIDLQHDDIPPERHRRLVRSRRRRPDPVARHEADMLLAEIERRVTTDEPPIDLLRDLANRGLLADTMAIGSPAVRTVLVTAAYAVAMPVVFDHLTRCVERRRNHPACATSMSRMADVRHDRFQDDVEAVVLAMLRNSHRPIRSLEAWIAGAAARATVDAHRGDTTSVRAVHDDVEMDDRHLRDLAHDALRAIDARVRSGEDPNFVVIDVIETVFNGDLGTHDLGRMPTAGWDDDLRLADRINVDRIIRAVVDILRDSGCAMPSKCTNRTSAGGH